MDKVDKISGIIFGEAIGDALGLGAEGMSKAEMMQHYPDGLIYYDQIIQDHHRSRWQKGMWTDDTAMMLCIAKAIIQDKNIVYQSIAKEFKNWFDNKPFGIGNHTRKILNFPRYLSYPEEASKMVWEMSRYSNPNREYNAANGGIMRTPIIGIWHKDIELHAEKVCKLSHYDPRCVGSCVIVSVIINRLLNDNPISIDEIVGIGRKYDDRIEKYVRLAQSEDILTLELDDKANMRYTLKTMAAGIWVLLHSDNFSNGLQDIVNAGGDTDTNAAVACSILGAKYGYGNIPKQYIDGLCRKDYLMEIAQQLAKFV